MRRWLEMAIVAFSVIGGGLPAAAEDSQAWQPVQLEQGMTEFALWGALDTYEGDEVWLWLAGDVGFLLSPRHEIGPSLNVQVWLFDWEAEASGSCGGFYRYNIPLRSRRWAPFLGVRALSFLGGPREWDAEARVEGGFRHFLAEGAAVTVTGFYARRFGQHCDWGSCGTDADRLGVSLGLSMFF
ncbi:MAG TPA: hypothetical protein PKJ99_02820 [Thermoanaerobaculales bacterium]|nr:hypothetical protein [Thermoanaerobaculales bacterium]HPA80263.1 hypothetical protein [Thermoanaerobaculales bacterium]HQL29828.1 hypothetical protein [Thermoanaerobaculales bacterium]HQN95506.1 hypothetical protein [Thermoanaerobaculales bacterium]